MSPHSTGRDISVESAQVARILKSAAFQGSSLLKAFLSFITTEALEGRAQSISEYTIATKVFGRSDDFDPASATIVRTQAYRLRHKLAEYYQSEGADDEILIEIPKGHYVPTFSPRRRSVVPPLPEPAPSPRRRRFTLAGLLLFAAGTLTGWLIASRPVTKATPSLPAGAMSDFWTGFARPGEAVVIGYTNPVYITNGYGDLFNSRGIPAGARGEMVPNDSLRHPMRLLPGPFYFEDGFTGTGEVPAVYRLASLLEKAGVSVLVKRSRTVTVEDMRNHNVIFLGSGTAAQALQNIKFLRRFEFNSRPPGAGLWRNSIVDHEAPPDSAAFEVERDPVTQSLRTDYAVLAVIPSVVPSRRVMVMAGLTTSGTEGAAEYATSEHNLRNLFDALGQDIDGKKTLPRHFETVLRVEVAKGLDAVKSTFVKGGEVASK